MTLKELLEHKKELDQMADDKDQTKFNLKLKYIQKLENEFNQLIRKGD